MLCKAYAKINLGLRVIRKREDGFHDIETIFHRINLFDELTLDPSPKAISITCSNPALPTDGNNLCWKAVETLRSVVGTEKGALIYLKKNIPVGAGLGGGSSDAAAVLLSLPILWKTPVDASTLAEIALQIGSDVPFFLHNRTAYAEGRGERLQFITLPLPYWILLVTPPIHVSTGWAYKELSLRKRLDPQPAKFYDGATCKVARISTLMQNDFEDIVFPVHAEIGEIRRQLLARGATFALMSGSGSSVFGLFENADMAQSAGKFFGKQYQVSLTEPHFVPAI